MSGRLPPPPPLLSCLFSAVWKFRRNNSGATVQSRFRICPIWRFEQNLAEVGVLMLSVYTRRHPDCKNTGDKTWRRCSCPKLIWGSLCGKFIRQSAKTHRWEEAEELRRQLSEGLVPANRPAAKNRIQPSTRRFRVARAQVPSDPKSAVANWQRSYRRLGVPDALHQ